MTALETALAIAAALDKKQSNNIRILEIGGLTTIGEYFVVASGQNVLQTRALADTVEESLSALGREPGRTEGYSSGVWVLLDYGDVIVHLFEEETRRFYSMERLWADAPVVQWKDEVELSE